MIDGHAHLENGPLTKEYCLKMIEGAINNNIDELQILDHTHRFKEFAPLYERMRINKAQIDWLNDDLRDSIYDYIKLIKEMKKETLPINVKFGLEVCYTKDTEDIIKELIKVYDFDFLVGSVHSMFNVAYDSKWSIDELWNKYNPDEIYKEYFDTMYHLVESDLFTQIGHPDTIKMFNIYPSFNTDEYYDKLAKLCIEHNVKVENNVGCFYRYHHSDIGLSENNLRIFKSNGCQMITVSDAHYPEHVGIHIKDIWNKTMY